MNLFGILRDCRPAKWLAIWLLLLAGCSQVSPEASNSENAPSQSGQEKFVLAIRGMTCEGCVSTVTSAIGDVPGVQTVDVSLPKQQAVVTAAAGQLDKAAIMAAVKDAGYETTATVDDATPADSASKSETETTEQPK